MRNLFGLKFLWIMTIYNENVRYNWDVFLRLLRYSKDRKWVGFYYFKVDLIFALNVRQRIHIFHIGKKTLQLSRKLYSSHCLKPVISGSRFTTSIAWGIFTTYYGSHLIKTNGYLRNDSSSLFRSTSMATHLFPKCLRFKKRLCSKRDFGGRRSS